MTEKIYIENPYLKETSAKIVRKYKQNHKYFYILDKTIFYPHLSGGQTRDFGKINDIEVIDVFINDQEEIVHVTDSPIEQNKVLLKIDWENRFDNMQQHTGQHILSSSFKRLLNVDTVGFSLGKNFSYIVINRDHLSLEEAAKVELLANRIIQSNFRVKSLKSLSENKAKTLYSVEIGGIDSSQCCGTHVRDTGEIGLVKIRKWEAFKGNTRIEFFCGQRAIKNFIWKNQYINSLSQIFSSKDRELVENIEAFVAKVDEKDLEIKRLRQELLSLRAQGLVDNLKRENNVDYIIHRFRDSTLREVKSISNHICQENKNIVQIYTVDNKNSALFLVSRGDNLNLRLDDVLNRVNESIIVNAGGNEKIIQGTSNLNLLGKIEEIFLREIKNQLEK